MVRCPFPYISLLKLSKMHIFLLVPQFHNVAHVNPFLPAREVRVTTKLVGTIRNITQRERQ